jgi:hypothetical protein
MALIRDVALCGMLIKPHGDDYSFAVNTDHVSKIAVGVVIINVSE